ncbi:TpaD [Streptomyces coelicoflavus ZG0656]|nr:TpaD [Streptomyces coelicoflavus ZG0656]MZE43544.1 TOMM precursor leader peptide-binding protein [Streptomyces sp. SID5477]
MNPQLLVLASGTFGQDVARRLAHGTGTSRREVTLMEIDEGTHPSLWPHADVIVLATSQERPHLFEATDRAAFAWRVPWLGVYPTATEMRCGPVVIPGRTACYECYARRRNQHRRPDPGTTSPENDRYPTGYPEHHVGIAAALARQAIEEALGTAPDDEQALGGTVRSFDQVTGATSRASVVAVDRCARCRTRVGSEELWRQLATIDEGRTA